MRNLGIITLKWGLLINEGRSIFCTKFNSKMFGVYKCIHKIYFPSKNSTSLLNAIGMPVSKYACDDDQLLSGRLSTWSRWRQICNTMGLPATIYSLSIQCLLFRCYACCLMFTAYCLRMLDLRLKITTCLETPGEFWTKI